MLGALTGFLNAQAIGAALYRLGRWRTEREVKRMRGKDW